MRLGRQPRVRTVERIDDAREADERVLEHLVRLGCDPAAPREVRHFVFVPAQAGANAVAGELSAEGWLTSVERSDDGWLVVATRIRTLTSEIVRETRVRLETLASRHCGLYDGWEAPTV